MNHYQNSIGVQVPRVLLPQKGTDLSKWAVVACDQFTAQPDYWAEAESIVGKAPSTLHMILPEAFLGMPDESHRIERIKTTMRDYLLHGVLEEQEPGFVLVTRSAAGKTRTGLVLALDLEHYDYRSGAQTLIRATEETIAERIPPRLRIRAGAQLELPHILVLIDDPGRTVIEPLVAKRNQLPCLYDTELMLGGGRISGHLVSNSTDVQHLLTSLTSLAYPDGVSVNSAEGTAPLLFAMGDGNHSLATAKANWEQMKTTLPKEECENHPARYALVEVENVHDENIIFEPIHRVVCGRGGERAVQTLLSYLKAQNGDAATLVREAPSPTAGTHVHELPFVTGNTNGVFQVVNPVAPLAVGTLQNALDTLLLELDGVEVDYIHGADVVHQLAKSDNAIGFILPAVEKSDFFPTVIREGALPRKTFSMGEATEKRYYMECRQLFY